MKLYMYNNTKHFIFKNSILLNILTQKLVFLGYLSIVKSKQLLRNSFIYLHKWFQLKKSYFFSRTVTNKNWGLRWSLGKTPRVQV